MRRWLWLTLALLLALPAAVAEDATFVDVAGTYDFCSGVGAWSTDLTILPDGTFTGSYHDTDMEDDELNGVHYDAICYACSFKGRLSPLEHSNAQEMDCKVLELSVDAYEAYVDEGIRFEPVQPYGIAEGDALRFYMAGAYVDALPEELVDWLRMKIAIQEDWTRVPFVSLYNETQQTGFSGPEHEEISPTEPEGTPVATWVWTQPTPEPQPAGLTFPVDARVVNCRQCVSLRSKPAGDGPLLAEAALGDIVQVYSNAAYSDGKHWFVDAGYNGQRGYICIEYLDILLPQLSGDWLAGAAGTITAVASGTDLLMRSGPGKDFEVTGLLFGGETLAYLGDARMDGSGTCWYHASYYGAECWISATYTALTLESGATYTGKKGIF